MTNKEHQHTWSKNSVPFYRHEGQKDTPKADGRQTPPPFPNYLSRQGRRLLTQKAYLKPERRRQPAYYEKTQTWQAGEADSDQGDVGEGAGSGATKARHLQKKQQKYEKIREDLAMFQAFQHRRPFRRSYVPSLLAQQAKSAKKKAQSPRGDQGSQQAKD